MAEAPAPQLFPNVQIVDPQSPHHLSYRDVWVDGETITRIEEPSSLDLPPGQRISLPPNTCISPGWMDIQVHLQDPGFEWKETLEQLSQAALKGGFTSLHCLTETNPVADNSQVLHSLQCRSAEFPVEFLFSGAITVGRTGKDLAEIYEMFQAGAVSFSDGVHLSHETGVLLRALEYAKAFDALLLCYPYDRSLAQGGMVNEGKAAISLGMKGIPELAEIIGVEKAIHLARYAGAALHLQPITSGIALEKIREAKTAGSPISVATGIPYFALSDEVLHTFEANYKVFPPLRNSEQVGKLRVAIAQGWIDAIGTCHIAQSVEEKNLEFGLAEFGMLGLQTAFPLINQFLLQRGHIDLSRMVELLSIGPRRILRQPPVSIQEGAQANITVFNLVKDWILTEDMIPSRAKNSPFLDQPLKGKILGVYVNGAYFSDT